MDSAAFRLAVTVVAAAAAMLAWATPAHGAAMLTSPSPDPLNRPVTALRRLPNGHVSPPTCPEPDSALSSHGWPAVQERPLSAGATHQPGMARQPDFDDHAADAAMSPAVTVNVVQDDDAPVPAPPLPVPEPTAAALLFALAVPALLRRVRPRHTSDQHA